MSSLTMDPSYTPVEKEEKPRASGGGAGHCDKKLALVIPTLHEAESLCGLLIRVRQALDTVGLPYEVVVVDDDSGDGTDELVSAIALKDPRVRLLVRKDKRGLAGAIVHGWESTDATILGVMDADMQHPPELLPELLSSILHGHDLVIGSRYASGGGLGEWNPMRRLASAMAVLMTLPLQRPRLRAKDPMSGFFLVRRHCVQDVAFRQTGFKLLFEILVLGRVRSVQEIPFAFGRRTTGCSKASLGVGWEYLLLLVSLYRRRWLYGVRRGIIRIAKRAYEG